MHVVLHVGSPRSVPLPLNIINKLNAVKTKILAIKYHTHVCVLRLACLLQGV